MSKKIPKFQTREAAAEYWVTHDTTDYWDDMEDIELEIHPSISRSQDLSRRCPICDQVLRFRYVDRDSQNGQVTMHLMEFYCPEGHFIQMAAESAKLVRAIEAMLALRSREDLGFVEEPSLASKAPELAPA